MTTQPNEHQEVLLDYVSKTLGIFSAMRFKVMTRKHAVEEANNFDINKLNKAVDWMLKAEVRE